MSTIAALEEGFFNGLLPPSPDANGEFATPAEGAKFMASFGIPQIPLRGKAPFMDRWQDSGSTDFVQIDAWYAEYKCNFGSIAKADSGMFWVLEVDSNDVSVRHKLDVGTTFTPTLTTISRQGGHRWYTQTIESLAMGNLAQGFVKGGDSSCRVHNQQCVSPGSLHPTTGQQYRVSMKQPMAPTAATLEEIGWLVAQKIVKTDADSRRPDGWMDASIPDGKRNDTLCAIGFQLRHAGLHEEEIYNILVERNHRQCATPLLADEVRSIAHSVSKDPTDAEQVLSKSYSIGGKSFAAIYFETLAAQAQAELGGAITDAESTPLTRGDIDTSSIAMPEFPYWVMKDTSVYRNLVVPACEGSARHEEFVFVPAAVIIMNYLNGKVGLVDEKLNFVQFLGLISRFGNYAKSTSVEMAFDFAQAMGILNHYSSHLKNADGKVIVAAGGSPEGFGMRMNKINADKAVLYYDELKKIANKAGIENSSFGADLLTMAEAGLFENTVKKQSESFCFHPGSYSFGLIWCTTTKGFATHWVKLAGMADGLDDRHAFLVYDGPQRKGRNTRIDYTNGEDGRPRSAGYGRAQETRALIEAATTQHFFAYTNPASAEIFNGLNDNLRSQNRANAWATFFAIDLGLKEINNDCIQRGLAMANYFYKMWQYQEPPEGENKEAVLESTIIRELRRNGGYMAIRDLEKDIHGRRYGVALWKRTLAGLLKEKYLIEWDQKTKSGQKTHMIGIRIRRDDD